MTIKEFRLSQKLSQPKLAAALGIGVSTIGGYETGRIKPSAKVIEKIKEVFGVDLNAPEAPARKARKPRVKKAEAAPAAEAVEKAPRARKAVKKAEAAPAEAVEKAPRARKAVKMAEAAPAAEAVEKKAPRARKAAKKPAEVIIQSPIGGEITPEAILEKVGEVDRVYVRVDQNTVYWVKGEESGAVNLW